MSKIDEKPKVILDAVGQELAIGDCVAVVDAGTHDLTETFILRFTPKGVSVSTKPGGDFYTNRRYTQVMKIPKELLLLRILEN